MSSDSFYEQLVRTVETPTYKLAKIAYVVFGVLGLILLGFFYLIPGIILLLFAVGLFFFKKGLYLEYEYDFTNGEIDFDKITEKKSRKRILTINVKDIELLAPVDSDAVKSFNNKPKRTMQFVPSTAAEKVYAAIVTGGTERILVLFIPDEKLLSLCYKYNPRAVKQYF